MGKRTFLLMNVVGFLVCGVGFASPPVVVKAEPGEGATDVNPATTQMRITFDQPMNPRSFSVVGGGERFPLAGKPRWADDKTLVLPIALKPEHFYGLSVNSARFQGLRNQAGESAVPYSITFNTAPAGGSPPLSPQAAQLGIANLKLALESDYSYYDVHKVDWHKAFSQSNLQDAPTSQQFAQRVGKMLAATNDLHISVRATEAPSLLFPAASRRVDPNCNPQAMAKLVPALAAENGMIATGKFEDGTAYIMIQSFEGTADQLEPAFAALSDAKAVILDVRLNSGGDETVAQQLAGCFVASDQVYAQDIIRKNGNEMPVLQRTLKPNSQHPTFTGKVALLIGPENMSSCESFIMMMKKSPSCTTIGERTWGSSGNPKPHNLGNGVTVMSPSWRDLDLNGKPIEGVGLTPDITVRFSPGNEDPILDRGLELLKAKP